MEGFPYVLPRAVLSTWEGVAIERRAGRVRVQDVHDGSDGSRSCATRSAVRTPIGVGRDGAGVSVIDSFVVVLLGGLPVDLSDEEVVALPSNPLVVTHWPVVVLVLQYLPAVAEGVTGSGEVCGCGGSSH